MQQLYHPNCDLNQLRAFYGVEDEHIGYLEKQFNVTIQFQDNAFVINGADLDVLAVIEIMKSMRQLLVDEGDLSLNQIKAMVLTGYFDKSNLKPITHTYQGKHIYPKTLNQHKLITTFQANELVFALGPAGCGKTFLAVAYGVSLLRNNDIKRIILVRPAVEAGESLGFLPGDLKEKIDPYLQPLYDSLYLLLGQEATDRFIEKKVIEIAPLAYMRGRTLDDALVILDEAQNTTKAQMKMFLTRMGFNSKMIITGDLTQIDLPKKSDSGLIDASLRLNKIDDIAFVHLGNQDIVRHPLVGKILSCYQD